MSNDFRNKQDYLAWHLVTSPSNKAIVQEFLLEKAKERLASDENVCLCVDFETQDETGCFPLKIYRGVASDDLSVCVVAKIDGSQDFDEIAQDYAQEFDYETVLLLSDEISSNLEKFDFFNIDYHLECYFDDSQKKFCKDYAIRVEIRTINERIAYLLDICVDKLFDGLSTNEEHSEVLRLRAKNVRLSEMLASAS